MAIQTITYQNKQYLDENSGIADINKVKDTDMNEIKSVVNNNATETSNNTTAVNNLTPIVLYNNENNTSLNVTLSDNSANYSYLEFYFTDTARTGFTKVTNPNGQNFSVGLVAPFNSEIQLKSASYSISGTSVTNTRLKAATLKTTGTDLWETNIYIIKVVGYK